MTIGNEQQDLKAFFRNALYECTGKNLEILSIAHKSGGCVNNAAKIQTPNKPFFIKWGSGEDMFYTETLGLELLFKKSRLKVPVVFGNGKWEDKNYLVMEHVATVQPSSTFWRNLGEGLAEIHTTTSAKHGLSYDNYIGRLPQCNTFSNSWVKFFIEHRLDFQLQIAARNQLADQSFQRRFKKLYHIIPDIIPEEPASLLHGDLWSGNILCAEGELACVIDPAVYYGSREVEIAFTHLFGGFDSLFYDAYEEAYPLVPGFNERIAIYNLYPLMVHANMFGASYIHSVDQILKHYA